MIRLDSKWRNQKNIFNRKIILHLKKKNKLAFAKQSWLMIDQGYVNFLQNTSGIIGKYKRFEKQQRN
jgi:hypothetical protein